MNFSRTSLFLAQTVKSVENKFYKVSVENRLCNQNASKNITESVKIIEYDGRLTIEVKQSLCKFNNYLNYTIYLNDRCYLVSASKSYVNSVKTRV